MPYARFIAMLSLALAYSVATGAAQQSPGKASIEGVVLRAGSGAPLPGARVTVSPEAPAGRMPNRAPEIDGPPFQEKEGLLSAVVAPVTTDAQGRFALSNLDPGAYRLYAEANGYVSQAYGQRQATGPGTLVTLTAGQTLSDAAFHMTPAGSVSGRIRDLEHRPLADVPVQLLRATYNPTGQQTLQPVGAARTNDRGEYRIYWIAPGRYYLKAGNPTGPDSFLATMVAGAGAAGTTNPNEVPAETALAFFPGSPDLAGARAVEVPSGADLTGIDWALPPPPPTYSVRARVIDSATGQPPPAAQAFISLAGSGLEAAGNGAYDIAAAMSLNQQYNPATGAVEIQNVAPGVYTISVMGTPLNPGFAPDGGPDGVAFAPVKPAFAPGIDGGAVEIPPSPDPPEDHQFEPTISIGSATVTVSGSNVDDGVVITLVPAGSIEGHLQVEGDLPAARWMTIQLVPLQGGLIEAMLGGPQFSRVDESSFHIRNVAPGEYRLDAQPLPANAYIKEARLNGADVLNEPLVWRNGGSGSLEVVVSAHGGQVRGTLTGDQATPVPDAQVILIPDNRHRLDLYKTTGADASGHFTFTGVAPGAYKVFSWERVEPFGWFNSELLERSQARASAVSVTESADATVEVQLIPGGGAQ